MGGENNRVRWRGVQPIAGIAGIWPAEKAVRVHANKENEADGTQIVYTVPDGKKLYLSNAILNSYQAAAQEKRAFIAVRNAGDVLQYYILQNRFGAAGQLVVSDHFVPALEADAGWDVVLTNESA